MTYSHMGLEEARGYLARAVLTQGPSFVYNVDLDGSDNRDCSYFIQEDRPEEDPARLTPCLIGVAVRLAGREVPAWLEGTACSDRGARDEWNLSGKAAWYFFTAQRVQDQGGTWGEAYAAAEVYAVHRIEIARLKAMQDAEGEQTS